MTYFVMHTHAVTTQLINIIEDTSGVALHHKIEVMLPRDIANTLLPYVNHLHRYFKIMKESHIPKIMVKEEKCIKYLDTYLSLVSVM